MANTLRRLGLSAVLIATAVAATALPAQAETPTGTISGQITGIGSGEFAQVTVYDTSYGYVTATGVNPDGSYQVEVPAGDYKLMISVGGFRQWAHQEMSFWDADTFTVAAGAELTVNEILLPNGMLTGTLLDGTTPVAGAYVRVSQVDGSISDGVLTDPQGRFTMRLVAGDYRVSFDLGDGLTQYYRQQTDFNMADVVTVPAGGQVEITETVLSTGSASGRLTEDGVGVAGAMVSWLGVAGPESGYAYTDADGRYRLPRLFPGEYRVSFRLPDGRMQWAHGKLDEQAADRFTVVANAETVVDEAVLPTGQVLVRAADARTGEPVTDFCANVRDQFGCAENGVVALAKVPVGRHPVSVSPHDDRYLSADGVVDVTAGTVAEVTVTLKQAGTITTVVRDRRGGKPVAGVCLQPVRLRFATLANSQWACSDEQGRVTLTHLEPDTYTLFTRVDNGVHGMQWVGRNGGTGSQFAAHKITVEQGQTVEAPPVLLDRAGSVSGRVTDKATGAPVADAIVSLLTAHPGIGDFGPSARTDADGRYTLANLGPYDWPLYFDHSEYAGQWSGGAPSRLLAKPVKVKHGKTVTADAALTTGTLVRGTVQRASGEAVGDADVTAYDAATGDIAAVTWVTGDTYEMRVLGPALVRFRVNSGWHREADSFDRATTVFIPGSGTKTVDIVIP
ncbi:MAG: carboxypeptidase-like regulatory domain-containing protein [Micromonosporaceae bacterium]